MTKIIGVSGAKRSGKTTTANFLHGYVLKDKEIIRDFSILDTGELVVNTVYLDPDGNPVEDKGVLDLTQQSEAFLGFAAERIWPHIKLYNFADALKELCVSLFGLSYAQVYGNDKNSLTNLRWENMPGVVTDPIEDGESNDLEKWGLIQYEAGPMTAREVMQFVGTEVFRRMHEPVWTDLVMNQIKADAPEIAVIADCRFDNEAAAIKKENGILIGLLRKPEEDGHASEKGVTIPFDLTIDNRGMSISETNTAVLMGLRQLGVL
jgi:hypothetical protein